MPNQIEIPISALIVLSLLGERKMHGYDIEKMIWNRGFKYWTDIGKTSIYNSLKILEEKKLVSSITEQGGGPTRKVFEITNLGRATLKAQGTSFLSNPRNPRHDMDLGVYILPFLTERQRVEALKAGIKRLEDRREFLKERLNWCRNQKLLYPALSFERPLAAIEAEIKWLKKLLAEIENSKINFNIGWEKYIYKEPPNVSD
ncbi:MAG: helix-turn-helix transcriptional regulator [Candidatus Omnitrophica bacterium]|nr:helix-turn-helix transcriptional regulator [Candidatus Omnitrophota bacterium]